MKSARIENGLVADLWEVPSLTAFEGINLIAAPENVAMGWGHDGENFTAPAPDLAAAAAPIANITPRQIRMALTRAGLRASVEAAVAAGSQDLKDWYEFSTTFERDNAQVIAMGEELGVDDEALDGLWALGATL